MHEKLSEIAHYIKVPDIIFVVLLVVIILVLYIQRKRTFVREIVKNAVIETEKFFNSNSGQTKLEYCLQIINSKLPFICRLFLTKAILITMIESTLKGLCKVFTVDLDVDIVGNEGIEVHKKLDLNLPKSETKPRIVSDVQQENKDTEVYANIQAETDWHGEPKTKVEVGIKKKF